MQIRKDGCCGPEVINTTAPVDVETTVTDGPADHVPPRDIMAEAQMKVDHAEGDLAVARLKLCFDFM